MTNAIQKILYAMEVIHDPATRTLPTPDSVMEFMQKYDIPFKEEEVRRVCAWALAEYKKPGAVYRIPSENTQTLISASVTRMRKPTKLLPRRPRDPELLRVHELLEKPRKPAAIPKKLSPTEKIRAFMERPHTAIKRDPFTDDLREVLPIFEQNSAEREKSLKKAKPRVAALYQHLAQRPGIRELVTLIFETRRNKGLSLKTKKLVQIMKKEAPVREERLYPRRRQRRR